MSAHLHFFFMYRFEAAQSIRGQSCNEYKSSLRFHTTALIKRQVADTEAEEFIDKVP